MNSPTEFAVGLIAGIVGYKYFGRRRKKIQVKEKFPIIPSTIPPYLANNDWEQELNFKLWVTKGARFQADKRCSELSKLSQIATSFLTAYVIILGLVPYFIKGKVDTGIGDLVSFLSSSLSVLLLAYTLTI